MENNKKIFRPKRLREWLMYANLYQLKKCMRGYRNFVRRIGKILQPNIKGGKI